jgi:LacI family transcriptional regulator
MNFKLGNYEEALRVGFCAYRRLKHSSEHGEVADVQVLIANCYHRLGMGGEAEDFFMDALSSYRRVEDRAGIAYEPQLVADGEFDFDSGVRAGRQLLDASPPPTAIFAANDDMAAGVLAVAHDRGLDLPGDLSVAGFDDTTLARSVWPPLTTIRQPMFDLAHTATDILIAGGDINHRRLPHTLVERASIAPPRRKPA